MYPVEAWIAPSTVSALARKETSSPSCNSGQGKDAPFSNERSRSTSPKTSRPVTETSPSPIVADYPEKFIGVAGIDPTNRAKALEEIERFVVNGPLKAVGMEPGVLASPMYADDRRIYPIYEYCAEHGIPVLLMGGGGNGPDLSHSNPIIIDRVCGDFPEMTVINTHGGYPWVTEILFVAFKRPNLYLCPDMYMYNMPGVSDYVMAANTFLSERFLFGTAYPFIGFREGVEQFKALPFKPEVLPNLLYRNAIKALKLDIPCGE